MAWTRLIHHTNEPIIEMDGKLNTIAGTRNLLIPRDDPTDLRELDGNPSDSIPKRPTYDTSIARFQPVLPSTLSRIHNDFREGDLFLSGEKRSTAEDGGHEGKQHDN